jgi:hypothetical protein
VKETRMLSASGLLGYGFPEDSLKLGMQRDLHMVGVDGGSSDPGPHYLGSGKCVNSRMAMKRDMALLLKAAMTHRIPMIIGSCGGAGGEPHLQACTDILREVAREEGFHFKLAVIHAEQKKDWLKGKLAAGKVHPLGAAGPLQTETIDRAVRIVGMMGPEPYLEALGQGAQIILAGRSTDPAPWAALAMHRGLPPAPSWYAGKMLECGTGAAVPKGHDCQLAAVGTDYVDVEPASPARRCTPLSVAIQALHENASPTIHKEPGGMLDTTDCRIEAVSDRTVRISGMRWTPQPYTIKLEGAELAGYSAMTIAGTRDPGLIGRMDEFLKTVREAVAFKTGGFGVRADDYQLVFRVYGRDGVMGAWEPERDDSSHELGLVVEAVADTQEIASAVTAIARVTLLHTDFPGRLCKEGNMAFPFSPSDIERGAVYQFSLRHVVEPDSPLEMFPVDYESI